MSYLFRRDDIETTKIFRTPTYEDLNKLVFFMSKYDEYKNYKIFVSGGLLEKETTKDIDIDICGLRTSKNDLYDFMKSVYRYGVEELNILVDLGYYENTEYQIGKRQRRIDAYIWYSNEVEIVDDKVVRNYNFKEKENGLYKVSVLRPSLKQLRQRYRKGYYRVN
jgi:hypothetical protein